MPWAASISLTFQRASSFSLSNAHNLITVAKTPLACGEGPRRRSFSSPPSLSLSSLFSFQSISSSPLARLQVSLFSPPLHVTWAGTSGLVTHVMLPLSKAKDFKLSRFLLCYFQSRHQTSQISALYPFHLSAWLTSASVTSSMYEVKHKKQYLCLGNRNGGHRTWRDLLRPAHSCRAMKAEWTTRTAQSPLHLLELWSSQQPLFSSPSHIWVAKNLPPFVSVSSSPPKTPSLVSSFFCVNIQFTFNSQHKSTRPKSQNKLLCVLDTSLLPLSPSSVSLILF